MELAASGSTANRGLALDRFGQLLLAWQEGQKEDALERLLFEANSLITSVASRTLRVAGFDGPNFVDDTLSLVSDHLRRLPPSDACSHRAADLSRADDERTVQPFSPRPHDELAGIRFLTWLAQRRAADVARRAKRQRRVISSFSEHGAAQLQRAESVAAGMQFDAELNASTRTNQLEWIYQKLDELSYDEKLLMDLSLAGKSLAVIAHVLGCCEGTVCRRRQRIEAWLQEAAHLAAQLEKSAEDHRAVTVNKHPVLKDQPDCTGEDELLNITPRLGHPIG